jgi:hypothetical protein
LGESSSHDPTKGAPANYQSPQHCGHQSFQHIGLDQVVRILQVGIHRFYALVAKSPGFV